MYTTKIISSYYWLQKLNETNSWERFNVFSSLIFCKTGQCHYNSLCLNLPVHNDWEWKSENEGATKSTKSAHNFSGKRRWSDVTISEDEKFHELKRWNPGRWRQQQYPSITSPDSSESHEPPPDWVKKCPRASRVVLICHEWNPNQRLYLEISKVFFLVMCKACVPSLQRRPSPQKWGHKPQQGASTSQALCKPESI